MHFILFPPFTDLHYDHEILLSARPRTDIWLIPSYATFYVAYLGRAAWLRFALVAPIDGAGDGDA